MWWMRLRASAAAWLRRYLPAEVAGIAAALLGAWLVWLWTRNTSVAAVASAWFETAGYHLTMATRELAHARRARRQQGAPYGPLQVARTLAGLVWEFGPAEALDSLLLRPLLMYLANQLIPWLAVAVLAGKLAADVTFYLVVIAAYESRRHAWRLPL